MDNKKNIYYKISIIILGWLSAYYIYLQDDAIQHHKSPQHKATQFKKITPPTITIPKGSRPVEQVEQTRSIGTIDHPTIDGGLINYPEWLLIQDDYPKKSKEQHTTLSKAFDDTWASDKKVKQLLLSAASDGKLDYVLKKAEEFNLPATVAIIPMIESQYQTRAESKKGAAGAWQLMPSVAEEYGISNEERYEFFPSTQVALKLLSKLYQTFNNWDLAFAAYNAGSQRIAKALSKNPAARNIDDLDIPKETKEYVSHIKLINNILGGHKTKIN